MQPTQFYTLPVLISFLIGFMGNLIGAHAAASMKSFTPTSILIPLRAVYLGGENHAQVATLHECNSRDPNKCLIDIADAQALAEILKVPRPIEVGNYHKLVVQTCKDEGTYTAKIKGSVIINETTYYTATNNNPLTTNAAANDYLTLPYSGCQRTFDLPSMITVEKDKSIDVSLFIPLTDIAWANLGAMPIPSGCVQDLLGTASVCMAYPDVTPYVGKTVPKLEVYSIYEPPSLPVTAGGRVLLLFDANDQWIGGTTRRFYSEDSLDPHGNYDTPIWIFGNNGDGTIHFENFGSTGTTSYLVFPAFERASHLGSFISNNWAGATFSYGAVKE